MYRGNGETAEVIALVDTGTSNLLSGSLDLKFAFGIEDALPMSGVATRFAAGRN